MAAGQFHIYSVDHVEQVMALLSGQEAGELDSEGNYSPGSFNRQICDRIEQWQLLQKRFSNHAGLNGEPDNAN